MEGNRFVILSFVHFTILTTKLQIKCILSNHIRESKSQLLLKKFVETMGAATWRRSANNGCKTVHFRSSCLQVFNKIGVLKNFARFTGKHLCWSIFLIKLQRFRSATSLKRDFNTGVFL